MPQLADPIGVESCVSFTGSLAAPRPQGRDGQRLLAVAARAQEHYSQPRSTAHARQFPFLKGSLALAALRLYSQSLGEDVGTIISDAAKHFTSAQIVRRVGPLSQVELETLFEDDQRTSGW